MLRTCSKTCSCPTVVLGIALFVLFTGCTSTVRFSSKQLVSRENKHSRENSPPDTLKGNPVTETESYPDTLRSILNSFMGTPYHWGGMSHAGIDCSGLVCCVFKKLDDVTLPHDARLMHKLGRKISLAKAHPGDLLFFSAGFWSGITHVGVYIGNGRFVHASTKLGVIESSMDDGYYRSRFVEARRLNKCP